MVAYLLDQVPIEKIALGVLAALALYVVVRGPSAAARDIAGGVIGGAVGAAEGAVIGIGEAVGIPATSQSKCCEVMRDPNLSAIERAFSVSLHCPALDYLGWMGGLEQPSYCRTGGGASGTW